MPSSATSARNNDSLVVAEKGSHVNNQADVSATNYIPEKKDLRFWLVVPLYGQLADFFGRRRLLAVSIAIFILGSGVCGGASSMNMLIAGRTVQGIGSAGINLLVELVICDLVPLRERGQYTAIIYSAATVGAAMGPWIGGEVIAKASWRWVFYINLPIGGASLIMVLLVLRVTHRQTTLESLLRNLDIVGNIIFAGATVSIMIALIYGGVTYPWHSWHVLVPLILGVLGLVAFAIFETSPLCNQPSIPRQVFNNRTSIGALLVSFFHSSLLTWVTYFISVYFQTALRASPARAGVDLLPNVFGFIPAAAIAGAMLTKFGRYRPWQFAGLCIMTIGMGLYSLLDQKTPTYGWVLLVFFFAVGCGLVMPSLLPALQAKLSDAESAAAIAVLTIGRNFGSVSGTVIPSIIFNNQFDRFASSIADNETRSLLFGGDAYTHATADFINSLNEVTQEQVITTFVKALDYVWYVGIIVCFIAFVCVFLEEEIGLRTTLESDFGLEESQSQP
ncbi:multidrug resistance protein fnx1 protein [Purpureocillium lavendulum]|uniref:Multidrug resistance protein fnx1 protein n=1 Tax=Purpureocillium lavendulum TaxID=1247861 RepID=A0AB34FT82_9HYPO|nr:multidrug resistance protein fnx1 protein [Purpureocillium lavendulum]